MKGNKGKYLPNWEGTYTITQIYNNGYNLRLVNDATNKYRCVHKNQIRLYENSDDEEERF